MTSKELWRSKLGHSYPREEIERKEKQMKKEVDHLRKQVPENRVCADCGTNGTVWASVNLGIFLCMGCGGYHRGLGTHVSQPKGCTGTYLWGPDEVENMRAIGNARAAKELYGGEKERPAKNASDQIWRKYIQDKYEFRKFAPKPGRSNKYADAIATKHHKNQKTGNNKDVVEKPRLRLVHNLSPINKKATSGQKENDGLIAEDPDLIQFDFSPAKHDKDDLKKKLGLVDKGPDLIRFDDSEGQFHADKQQEESSPVGSKSESVNMHQKEPDFFEQFGL